MLEILIATNNQNKVKEYKDIFDGYDVKVYSLKDLNINVDPIENGKTYFENALIKVNAIKPYTTLPIIADDSGIEIEGLGEHYPGIYSHRYMEEHGGQIKTNDMLVKTCLGHKAKFHCSIVLGNIKNKSPIEFVGEVLGSVSEIKNYADFGYDPIFKVNSLNKTYAELSKEEKDKISHRYLASIKLLNYLKENKYI
jgi:Xanthosine triphosphate pyrophosphatase